VQTEISKLIRRGGGEFQGNLFDRRWHYHLFLDGPLLLVIGRSSLG